MYNCTTVNSVTESVASIATGYNVSFLKFTHIITDIFVRRPSCLELTARTSATNHFNRPFQALSKNVFIRADIALSALETFCSMT